MVVALLPEQRSDLATKVLNWHRSDPQEQCHDEKGQLGSVGPQCVLGRELVPILLGERVKATAAVLGELVCLASIGVYQHKEIAKRIFLQYPEKEE